MAPNARAVGRALAGAFGGVQGAFAALFNGSLARLPADELKAIPLKRADRYRFIGRSIPRLDIPEKVDARAAYGIDVFLPGMAYAKIAYPPTRNGGKHRAVDDSQDAEPEREARLEAGPQPREGGDRADPGGQRDQAGERVLTEPEPRPAVDERVVDGMHEGHENGDGEDTPHRASSRSKKPTTRCSYSAGRAARPPTWCASGISHSVAASPAARA